MIGNLLQKVRELAESVLRIKRVDDVVVEENSTRLREFWELMEGVSDYNYADKQKSFRSIVNALKEWTKDLGIKLSLGDNVLDVGSGPKPMSFMLTGGKKKLVTIDFIPPQQKRNDNFHVNKNIKSLLNKSSFAFRRTLVEVAKFLGVDLRDENTKLFDSVIMSDILNYVPFRPLVKIAVESLKPGGLMVIYNQPGRTFTLPEEIKRAVHSEIMDKGGVKTNKELLEFAASLGVELVIFQEAPNPPGYEGEKNMLLILRKPEEK